MTRQATYEWTNQRFANDRAEIDARTRAAKEAAEEINLRLAAFFASEKTIATQNSPELPKVKSDDLASPLGGATDSSGTASRHLEQHDGPGDRVGDGMVALKGAAIETFLARPDRTVVLVYGPDTGLVTERAGALVAKHLDGDQMGRVVLDGDQLAGDPGRLADEAHSVPMFGGRQAIRVTQTTKNIAPAVQALLEHPSAETLVVLEAGDLKPSAPLRKMVEASSAGAALPCYADDEGAVDRLITQEAQAAGLEVSQEARAALRHLLGGDRLASRGELVKLTTYCMGLQTIALEDVVAVCGDASALTLDEISDAAFLGETGRAEQGLHKALEAGVACASIVSSFSRHLMQLMVARERIDGGATADAAMRELRPPVFFKRQTMFRRQLSLWSTHALGRMLPQIARAEADTRLRPDIQTEIVSRLILSISTVPRASGRR